MSNASCSNGRDRRSPRWHRIQSVREREGLSLQTLSRRLKVRLATLRDEEQETNDLRLSQLYFWQDALRVPVTELVLEHDAWGSDVIRQRGCLLRIARTAKTLLREANSPRLRRLTQSLVNLIYEAMPETRDVSEWHEVGQRRDATDVGRIAQRPIPSCDLGPWASWDDTTTHFTCDT